MSFRTLNQLLALLFIAFVVVVGCKKEDKIVPEPHDPNDTTQNNNPDTTANPGPKEWDLPWPEWVFYHWVWEDESTQQSATALVDDYLAHDIPVGAIIIDSPWETGYNTFEFDQSMYPNPQGMIDYLHSKDVRVMMWITSVINTDVTPLHTFAANNDYFMKGPLQNDQTINWWKGTGSMVDLFGTSSLNWWKGLMDKVLDMGIDGWKCDGTDFYALQTPYSPGKGGSVSRTEYSHAYYRLFHDYTRQKLGDDRVITARPVDNYGAGIGGAQVAFSPVDIGWACWVGDQDATFDGLKAALNNMYHSSQMGYLAFGSDIGGYREESGFANGRSRNLFIRWAQLGAFSPIMENGGGGEHRPWMFDQQTTDIYRKFVKLHHALVDYFMEHSEEYFNQQKSLMDILNNSDYRYFLGPDIFVAPVLEDVTSMDVTLPAGNDWVYLFNKQVTYTGGSTVTVNVPLDEYPVFLKEGSALIDCLDPDNL